MTMVAPTVAKIIRSLTQWKFKAATELTISSGAITATQSMHTVDTEGDASTDDLVTVNGIAENELVVMRPANDGRSVVFKHGSDNLECNGNSDITLDDEHDVVLLLGLSSTVAVMGFGSGGGLSDVVSDTSPQLGGHLDINGQVIGDGTDELLTFTEVGTPVNQFDISNAVTGSAPVLAAQGGDTNIDIELTPKGSGEVTSGGVSVLLADAAVAGTGLQEFLGLNLTDSTELTIATGAVTVTQGFHTIDTQSDAASDDLDTITVAGGQGDILFIMPESGARTVVVKHGTGNINCVGNADVTLDDVHDCCMLLRYDGSSWVAFSLSDSGSGLANVVEDATPQLGADLDMNAFGLDDSNGNELLKFTETASAVNELVLKNEAAGSYPGITATGGDTNVGIDFIPKGSGSVQSNGVDMLLADASIAGTGLQEVLGLNLTDPTELTIASGAVTVTQGLHTIDTEGGAGTDDLDTITIAGGTGDVLFLYPANGARTVVVKHNTGNVLCAGDSDITLDDAHDFALGLYDGSNWMMAGFTSAGGGISNVVEDTTPQLGGALDGQGEDLTSLGVVFLTEQAAAEADVSTELQLWAKTATPNQLWYTDDAGTDFQVASLAGTESLSNKTIAGATVTGVIDAGGATSFELPNSATPTVNADGEIAIDTTVADFDAGIVRYYSGEEMALVAMPVAQLSSPTNNHVVTYNSTTNDFVLAAATASLTNWTESTGVETTQFVRFLATHGDTNVHAVCSPKGSGAFITSTPDGAASGGNDRGTYAVDLQRYRVAAADVASGGYSFIGAGYGNTASGNWSAVVGGYDCEATGENSAVLTGRDSIASGDHSVVINGRDAAATRVNEVAHGWGKNTGINAGTQGATLLFHGETLNAVEQEIFLDSDSARFAIPTDTLVMCHYVISAMQNDGVQADGWYGTVACKNDGGTTSLVGSDNPTPQAGTTSWSTAFSADNTNDALVLKVTGETSKTIAWSAYIFFAQSVGA